MYQFSAQHDIKKINLFFFCFLSSLLLCFFLFFFRLSTIRSMDKIVVLQQGKVVEQGSHDDLATRQGVYANLLSAQMLK